MAPIQIGNDNPVYEKERNVSDSIPMRRKPLTPEEVAERWSCSPAHVRRLVRTGQLPCFRLGARLFRIRPEDVEAYEEKGIASAKADAPVQEPERKPRLVRKLAVENGKLIRKLGVER